MSDFSRFQINFSVVISKELANKMNKVKIFLNRYPTQNLKLIGSLSGEVTMGVTGLWKLIDGAGKQVSIIISMLPMFDVDYVQKF